MYIHLGANPEWMYFLHIHFIIHAYQKKKKRNTKKNAKMMTLL